MKEEAWRKSMEARLAGDVEEVLSKCEKAAAEGKSFILLSEEVQRDFLDFVKNKHFVKLELCTSDRASTPSGWHKYLFKSLAE